jgi:hypothetical protein
LSVRIRTICYIEHSKKLELKMHDTYSVRSISLLMDSHLRLRKRWTNIGHLRWADGQVCTLKAISKILALPARFFEKGIFQK